jgi:nucleosome binding factor SPN SPT16 subunit
LVDTIKVEDGKSTLLTEGVKLPKDTLFFLTQDSEEDTKPQKKGPTAPLKNGSPVKHKTAGTKVLRNQRRAVQDEVHQSAMAKMIEHQRDLHESLQTRGLARFSEDGGGLAGKEGKGWKKFQSYKGESALPPEVDKLRVCFPLYLPVKIVEHPVDSC